MATEIKAPNGFSHANKNRTIFLGGVIDQGTAVNWQKAIVDVFAPSDDIVILNPRRDAWDPSWIQNIDNEQFRQQVEWELDAQEFADGLIYVFAPDEESAMTYKAPITLMELGLFAKRGPEHVLVVCPKGYYRKGNVDIVCSRYGITVFESFDALVEHIHKEISF